MIEKRLSSTGEPAPPGAVQGEGDYAADRRYRTGAGQFAATADVAGAARRAAPRSAAEARELLAAEAIGRSHVAGAQNPGPADAAGAAQPKGVAPRAPGSDAGPPTSRR